MTETDSNLYLNRRKWLKTVAAGVGVGMAGCASNGGSSGNGGGTDSYTIGVSLKAIFDPFMQALADTTKWYTQSQGHKATIANAESDAAKQNRQVRNMLNTGIDALLISPYSSSAAVTAVEEATSQDVPVFAYNSTANTDAVKLFVAFGNQAAAYQAGKAIAKQVKESGGNGRLLEVKGDPADQAAILRSRGFHNAIEEINGVKIVGQVVTDWTRQEAVQKTTSYLRTDPNISGIYGAGGALMLGALQALDKIGRKVKQSQKGHVIVGGIDAYPEVIEKIQKGYIDVAIDQPNPYYGALSVEYILKYLNSGGDDSVLPEVGDKLTADEIKIDGEKRHGVDPWKKPYWAPASVVSYMVNDNKLHPQLKTQSIAVTQENSHKDFLWGNFANKIEI